MTALKSNQGEVEVTLYRLHKAQRRLKKEARRFNVACLGRRTGKTTFAVNLLAECAIAGKFAAYFAPTYKYVTPMWDELKKALAPLIARKDETEKRLELVTGAFIEMWSLDKDVARGRKYHLAVIDEAAMVAVLEKAWLEAIRPTLADFRGVAWFLSTPKGLNYFKICFDKGQDNLEADWMSWQLPTSSNPYIAPSEIEDMRRDMPEDVFNQEVLAQFLEGQGSVFRKIRAAATLPLALDPYQGDFVAGVDLAQSNDFTVITVIDTTSHRMVDFDRFNQLDWSFQRDRIEAMTSRWNIRRVLVEGNSIGGPNIEVLQKAGLPVEAFQTTATSKPQIIQSLALAFEQGDIEIINNPVLVSELESFERHVNPTTGRSSYSAPNGRHDDFVMSLALAWEAALSKPAGRRKIQLLS